jgi:peptidoglycan hydrolase-like amidase/peptidoglycan hydrolase CwlO-like protein
MAKPNFKIKNFWLSGLILVLLSFLFSSLALGVCDSNCDTIEECIRKQAECQKEIDARMGAHEKNKEDLANLEKSLKNTESLIQSAENQISGTEKEIGQREAELGEKEKIFAARVRSYYIRSFSFSPFLVFLSSTDAVRLARELAHRRMATEEDKKIILAISQDLKDLLADKEELEKNKAWLTQTKEAVNRQAQSLGAEIAEVEDYFSEVSGKIAQLSARQEALLAARVGTFTTSVGEVPVSRIPCSGPPGSPTFCDPGGGTWFAGFSLGAWTHRKGMSQYGAKGRAEAGQNANEILQAYYDRGPVGKDTAGTILVDGYGALDFENYYLLGIAEMPSDWQPEALKAQAIAARSYAYRYKTEGRSICTTQACQVFSASKANNPPAAWRQAVEQTRGQIIEGVTAFYSSTAGGYLTYPSGKWDTTDGQGGPGFASRAWESKAGSPWFYASWFTQNYTASSAKCNRSHPWLTAEEMADILNAWLVLNRQGSDDRILPVTINQCPIGGATGNPYSIEELRNKADGLGGAFTSVSSASVVYSNNGETNSVNFETNRGSVALSGSDFKQAFNLRAPGYIAIRSPLFNLERK